MGQWGVVKTPNAKLETKDDKGSDQQGDGGFMDEAGEPDSAPKTPEGTSGAQRAEPPSQEEAQSDPELPAWRLSCALRDGGQGRSGTVRKHLWVSRTQGR